MYAKRWLASVGMFVAFLGVFGCNRGAPAGSLATVSGTVTHNGVPVDGAKVIFHSTTEVAGKSSGSYGAQTDSSGKYLLVTAGKDPGIPPGMYKVTVVKLDAKGSQPRDDLDAGQMEASGMAKNMMPKDYEDPNRTKLSVTLEAGKNENKNFDLKGAASGGRQGAVP